MKSKKREVQEEAQVAPQVFTLNTKFQEEAVVPSEAFDRRFWEAVREHGRKDMSAEPILRACTFTTSDGKEVKVRFIGIYRDRCEEELENLCRRVYGLGFRSVMAVWASRFLKMEGYWYLIGMREGR